MSSNPLRSSLIKMNMGKNESAESQDTSLEYLQRQSIFRIGEVMGVDGREVSIRVDQEKNRSHVLYKGELLTNVSVGGYVKIIKGFHRLIGKIEKEYVKEVHYLKEYSQSEECFERYLGVKILGYFDGGKYHKGVKELPLLRDECFLLDRDEYNKIHSFQRPGEQTIRLGGLMLDAGVPIEVSIDRLFASHIGIFGNTGSGKSHTLATLYKNLFQGFIKEEAFRKNARFLLFDFNGEYSNKTSITEYKKVYKLSTGKSKGDKITISPDDILTPELFFILASATEKTQQPFIRRALRLYEKARKASDYLSYTKGILQNQLKRTLSLEDLGVGDLILSYFESILSTESITGKDASNPDQGLLSDISRHGKQRCFYVIENGNPHYLNDAKEVEYIEKTKIYKAIDRLDKHEGFISEITKFLYIQLIDDLLANRAQNEHVAPAINKLRSLSKDFSKVFEVPTDNGQTNPGVKGGAGDNSVAVDSQEVAQKEKEKSENGVGDSHPTTSSHGSQLWEDGKPLVVIDLNQVNTSMKKLIPLLLARKYYLEHKEKKEGKVTSSLNIIIDEAHNILSYESARESESWKDFRLETFEEIIKEGRKFGVFLTIASQRPSDISPTIISQLHNYLIHRLINQRDLDMVERAISYLDKLSLDSLPILPPGACVLSGVIADLPLIVQVDRLDEKSQPESQTIILTSNWKDPDAKSES